MFFRASFTRNGETERPSTRCKPIAKRQFSALCRLSGSDEVRYSEKGNGATAGGSVAPAGEGRWREERGGTVTRVRGRRFAAPAGWGMWVRGGALMECAAGRALSGGWILNTAKEKDCPGFTMADKEEKGPIDAEDFWARGAKTS